MWGQSVVGKVVDGDRNPIPFVNCILLHATDSSYATGAVSDEAGNFRIPAQAGERYVLELSYIGYEAYGMPCIAGDVGVIALKEDARLLGEVVAIGKRIEHRASGYSVNLKNSELAKGKQAPELLAFLPGVTVAENDIKVLAQSPHAIYIDGVKIQSKEELASITTIPNGVSARWSASCTAPTPRRDTGSACNTGARWRICPIAPSPATSGTVHHNPTRWATRI